ncbi:MAG: cobalamin biosynthesis protein CobQ [Pseudomonadota bacterium]
MNTPAHLIFGVAAFGRPEVRRTTLAALLGAMAPDFSLYVMSIYAMRVLGISPQRVFDELYYSDAWQQVFAVDNSFILWGIGLGVALWAGSKAWTAFAGAGLLHLAFDFPLHTHDARMHFWPLTTWKFESPVSYWDGSAYADLVGAGVLVLVAAALVVIFLRYKSWWLRGGMLALSAFEVMASGIWRFVF